MVGTAGRVHGRAHETPDRPDLFVIEDPNGKRVVDSTEGEQPPDSRVAN